MNTQFLLENGFKESNLHLAGREPLATDTRIFKKGRITVNVHSNIIVGTFIGEALASTKIDADLQETLLLDKIVNGENFVETRSFEYVPPTVSQISCWFFGEDIFEGEPCNC